MTDPARPFARMIVPLLVAAAMMSGCRDESAHQRAETQQKLLEANQKVRLASAGAASAATEESAKAKSTMEGLVAEIGRIQADDAGQQAARSMLLADALTQLAALDVLTADAVECRNKADCIAIGAIAGRSADLNHRVRAIDQLDLTPGRAVLDESRSEASQRLTSLNDQISELRGPIDDRVQRNQADSAEAAALRQQANDMMRIAREKGYAAGFDDFERAIQLQRQADLIEHDVAQREIELDLNLKAEHDYLALSAQGASSAIQSVESAESALVTFAQAGADDNAQSKQTLESLRAELDQYLASLGQRTSGELAPAYDAARRSFERAAQEAQSAAGKLQRDEAGAALTLAARINESLGKLHWARARGLASQRRAYEKAAEAADALGLGDSIYDDIDRLNADHEQALNDAKAAYEQAQEVLGRVTATGGGGGGGGGQSQLNAYKASLQLALDSLTGKDISADLKPARPAPATSSATPAAAVSAAGGFDSPEALLAELRRIKQSGNIIDMFAMAHTESAAARAELQNLRGLFDGLDRFGKAVASRFTDSAEAQQAGQMMQGMNMMMSMMMPDVSSLTEQSRAPDRVTYTFQTIMGTPDTLELILVNGRWFLDGEDLADVSSGGPGQDMARSVRAINDITARIERGEFSTYQQLQAAMEQAMSGGQ